MSRRNWVLDVGPEFAVPARGFVPVVLGASGVRTETVYTVGKNSRTLCPTLEAVKVIL
jgi:hypothetical protein